MLVKYHVYQQLKTDELKANLNMTMPHFVERWNIQYRHLIPAPVDQTSATAWL